MNNNAFEVLADGSEEGELVTADSFKFAGLVPDAKVSIQDKSFNKNDYPSTVSLLACSGNYGYFVAGHLEGFVFGQTQSLRATVYATEKGSTSTLNEKTVIPLALPAHQLRLSCDELSILVALSDGSLLSYSVMDILELKEHAQPKHSINLGTPIIDLRPNTEALPDSACVLLQGHQCRIINWKSGAMIATIPGSDFSAICWSPKGKQVACGRLDGTLEHYDLTGAKKDSLNSPESMQAGYGDENVNRNVQDVLWIENHQFLVLYSRPTEPDSDEFINDGYIIDRKPKTGTGPKYTHLAEVTPIFSPEGRSNHFYMETIRGFGAQFPHVVILANGATNELSVVGEDDGGNWATWDLPENGMASLPLSEETNCDTFPLGLALDYSATEKLPPYDPSESDVGVEPVPILFHLNDEGHIGSYHCYNEHFASSGTKYEGMKIATTPPATTTTTTTSESTPVVQQATSKTASAFDSKPTTPALSSSAFSSSPFGVALGSGSSGTSFASLTKVQGATTPSFGSPQGFGSSPGFGSLAQKKVPNAITPTFGSTTGFGAASGTSTGFGSFSSSSPAPAFGSTTSFGSMVASKDNAPVFGSTTSFGSTEMKTATPAFGSTTTTSGFGSTTTIETKRSVSSFGSTTGFGEPTAKKDDAATATTTTLPFGPTGFGFGSTEENNDSATPKSGSTSSFEMVTKNDTIQEKSSATDEKDVEQQEESSDDDLKRKEDVTDVPSFDSLAIGDQGKQEAKEEEKVTGYKLDKEYSDTEDALADEKEDNKESEIAINKDEEKTSELASKAAPTDTTTTSSTGFGALSKKAVPGAVNPTVGFGSSSTTSGPGFGALAKNTVPGATAVATPAFGTTSGFGQASGGGGGFGALAKNTVPGATAVATPAFGTTSGFGQASGGGGGFGALAKNTVPGAKAPTFGSTSLLGSGGGATPSFGSLAKNSVPGAVVPAFGSPSIFGSANKDTGGFGTTSSLGGTEKPATTFTTTTTTPPPAVEPTVKASVSPSARPSDTTTEHITQPTPLKYATPKEKEEKETVKVQPPVPKPEPKEEGMAKQFEALYFKITADLEKLSSLQGDFEKQLQSQNKQLTVMNKTVQDLTGDVNQWRLGECGQLGNIVDGITDQLNKYDINDEKEQVAKMELKTSELMNRKNQIEECLDTNEDPDMIARLADRDLDVATREDCESLELRCKNTGELLGELEYRIVNKTKQQRKPVQTDTSNFSFYDFHCAIRDVERDLKRKDAEVKDLEQKLLLLKFKEHQRLAEDSPSAITFEDLTDDEYIDALCSHESPGHDNKLGGRFTEQHIDYTVKYIQDEQVMDKLCTLTSQRPPSCVSADASKQ